jgi:hypothetical protein
VVGTAPSLFNVVYAETIVRTAIVNNHGIVPIRQNVQQLLLLFLEHNGVHTLYSWVERLKTVSTFGIAALHHMKQAVRDDNVTVMTRPP